MLKFVVLSALVCVAISAPAPGLIHGGYHGGYVLPAATSYSSRFDVHSAPIIKTYAAPIVTKTVVAAPIAPLAYSVHSAPLVSDYGYGLGSSIGLGHGYGGYSLGHGYAGLGYGSLGHGWGK